MKKDGKKKGDSGKLLKRVFQYVGKNYKYHLIFVLIGIFVSVLANVQGTMFMKTMIDDYIIPLTQAKVPDFAPFAWAIPEWQAFISLVFYVLICTIKS